MTEFLSTRQVAAVLDINPGNLQKNIWLGNVNSPSKGPSGQYLWTIQDIEGAAWALHCYERFTQWQSKLDSWDAEQAAKRGKQTIIGGRQ
jgi:hypothetical protein